MARMTTQRCALCAAQILKRSEHLMNIGSSRLGRRSIVATLICTSAVALVPGRSLFAQMPLPEQGLAQGRLSRPYEIGPGSNDEIRPEPPFTVSDHSTSSATVTLHDLSHHVPRRAVKEYERALKATGKGEKENAIAYLHKALAADPEFVAALNDLGVVYLKVNRVEVAIEQFTKAIAVDPHAALPLLNLAIAYLRQGLFTDAERAARRSVDLDRVGRYGRLVLGISSIMNGDFRSEAERSLTQAAQEYPMAKVWLALGLISRGDIVNARNQLRTYVADAGSARSNLAASLLQEIESVNQDRY